MLNTYYVIYSIACAQTAKRPLLRRQTSNKANFKRENRFPLTNKKHIGVNTTNTHFKYINKLSQCRRKCKGKGEYYRIYVAQLPQTLIFKNTSWGYIIHKAKQLIRHRIRQFLQCPFSAVQLLKQDKIINCCLHRYLRGNWH